LLFTSSTLSSVKVLDCQSFPVRLAMSGTVLGPLTTAWSPPDSCTVYVPECVGAKCTKAYRAQQCVGPQAWGSDNAECWPPVTVSTPKPPFQGWGYYSPGLVCPTGYTTACTAEYGGTSEWNMQFTLAPGETAVGCCPEYVGNHQPPSTWKSWLTGVSGDCRAQTGRTSISAPPRLP
jgi:hypothetical protein